MDIRRVRDAIVPGILGSAIDRNGIYKSPPHTPQLLMAAAGQSKRR